MTQNHPSNLFFSLPFIEISDFTSISFFIVILSSSCDVGLFVVFVRRCLSLLRRKDKLWEQCHELNRLKGVCKGVVLKNIETSVDPSTGEDKYFILMMKIIPTSYILSTDGKF